MENYEQILKGVGIEIPEDKKKVADLTGIITNREN